MSTSCVRRGAREIVPTYHDVLAIVESKEHATELREWLTGFSEATADEFGAWSRRGRPSAVLFRTDDCASPHFSKVVAELRKRCLEDATIVVTPLEAENAARLVAKWSGRVVWTGHMAHELLPAVDEVCARDLRVKARDLLVGVGGAIDEVVEAAIRHALLGSPPPATHADLARAVGVSPRTLRRRWQQSSFPGRPESLLDWGLIARMVHGVSHGESVNRACWGIGAEPWRVQRAARRRMGVAAGRIDEGGLLGALSRWVGRG